MKYAWIAAQGKGFPLTEMCDVLDVSVSGYRAWKRGGTSDRKRLSDCQMLALIRAIHAELKGAYGSPRMVRELRARGFSASKERVERLMRDNGIHARHKRRYKVTTDSKHGLPVAENLLAETAHDDSYCHGCADHGLVQETSGTGADAPLRPRQSVRQPCLSGQTQGIRHDLLDESKGELLG